MYNSYSYIIRHFSEYFYIFLKFVNFLLFYEFFAKITKFLLIFVLKLTNKSDVAMNVAVNFTNIVGSEAFHKFSAQKETQQTK